MEKRDINKYIGENFDRLHILAPKGTKDKLRKRFANEGAGMNVNRYINALLALDELGKVDWSGYNENR